jgi:L-asparaginase
MIGTLKIIYTGGTIGMRATPQGLAPAGGFDTRIADYFAGDAVLGPWTYTALEPPIDSANMGPAHWRRLQAAIVEAVEDEGCTAVLVLHGTDTLAYTAAALSFLLLGLTAPVVLTGAMLPAAAPDSDAWENLHGAVSLLRGQPPAGVHIYFHGTCLHGSRSRKVRSSGRHPFIDSPSPPAHLPAALPDTLTYKQPRTAPQLAVLTLFPGFPAAQIDTLVAGGVRGVVLQCYGSGTAPTEDPAFLTALTRAQAAGVVMLAISQCQQGGVDLACYEAGARLATAGVLSGAAMTLEAAIAKLHAVLGAGLLADEARHWMTRDLCGEMAP